MRFCGMLIPECLKQEKSHQNTERAHESFCDSSNVCQEQFQIEVF